MVNRGADVRFWHLTFQEFLAARLLASRSAARDCLRSARVGRMMQGRGLADEVDYAARSDVFDVVPKFEDGRLRPVELA